MLYIIVPNRRTASPEFLFSTPRSNHPQIFVPPPPPDQIIPRYSRLLDQIIQIFATPRSNHPQIFVPPDQIIPRYLCSPEQVIQIFTTPDQIILSFLEPTCSLAGGLSPTFINAFLKSLLAIASSFSSVMVTTGSGCHRSLSKKFIGQWKPNLTVLKNDPPLSL